MNSDSIRPMPRARAQVVAMLEQLEEIRADIHSLNDALRQVRVLIDHDECLPIVK